MKQQNLLSQRRPLSFLNFLRPAGGDCIIPSRSKARQYFRAQDLHGNIDLVNLEYNEREYAFWRLRIQSQVYVHIPAFAIPDFDITELSQFKQSILIQPNTLFFNGEKTYRAIRQNHDLVIKEISIYDNENVLLELEYQLGAKFDEVGLILTYTLQPRRDFISAAWHCSTLDDTTYIIPLFTNKKAAIEDIGYDDIDYDFAQAGDTFEQDGTLWLICENRECGFFIVPHHLQIMNKGRET